jgi:hypothetical protein
MKREDREPLRVWFEREARWTWSLLSWRGRDAQVAAIAGVDRSAAESVLRGTLRGVPVHDSLAGRPAIDVVCDPEVNAAVAMCYRKGIEDGAALVLAFGTAQVWEAAASGHLKALRVALAAWRAEASGRGAVAAATSRGSGS